MRQQLNATHDPHLDFVQLFKKKKKTVGCAVWHMGSWFLEAMTLHWKHWILTIGLPGKTLGFLFKHKNNPIKDIIGIIEEF